MGQKKKIYIKVLNPNTKKGTKWMACGDIYLELLHQHRNERANQNKGNTKGAFRQEKQ